jgi:hypothetical protein
VRGKQLHLPAQRVPDAAVRRVLGGDDADLHRRNTKAPQAI